MSKALKIFIPFLIVILFISGCSQSNLKEDDSQTEDTNNIEIIKSIDSSLEEYLNSSNNSYYETVIEDIEAITNSEFQQDTGSGRYILEFKYNEEISFIINGIPIDGWIILLNNEVIIKR